MSRQPPIRKAGKGALKKSTNAPPERSAHGIEREVIERRAPEFDNERWNEALERKRLMPPRAMGTRDPGPGHLAKLRRGERGVFLPLSGSKGDAASVRDEKQPDPHGSFGFVDVCIALNAGKSFNPGTLVVPFDRGRLGAVDRRTLRLFRWDSRGSRYELVPESGVGDREDYVWGLVPGGGIYTVIGLNTDPRVLATIRAFDAFSGYLAASQELRGDLASRLCELVQCNDGWGRALDDPRVRDRLRESGGYDWPTDRDLPRGGTGVCDSCRRLRVPDDGRIPDADLIGGRRHRTGYSWRSVGPRNMSGCVIDVVIDPTERHRLYAATANGGVWVLDDVRQYPAIAWRPLTDENRNLVAQAMAVAASDGNVIYYADGATNVLRSADRGATWATPTSQWFNMVRRMAVDPQNPNLVYVAARNGCWRTSTGGFAEAGNPGWIRVRNGQILDLALDPANSRVVYAGERVENPDGTRTLRLLRSPNRGVTWRSLHERTVPDQISTMITIALARQGMSDGRTVAVKFGTEVWVNRQGPGSPRNIVDRPWLSKGRPGDDRGDRNSGQGDWSHTLAIDPFDDDVMLCGGQEYYRTANGGDSWDPIVNWHEDQQGIAFDPGERNRVYIANDGGVSVSTDGGCTFRPTDAADSPARNLSASLNVTQFFHGALSTHAAAGSVYHWGINATADVSAGTWERVEGGAWEFSVVRGDMHRPNFFYVFAGGDLWRRRHPPVAGEDPFFPITPNESQVGGIKPTAIAVDPRPFSTTLLLGGIVTRANGSKRVAIFRTDNANERNVVTGAGGQGTLSPPIAWTEEPGVDAAPDDAIIGIQFGLHSSYALSATGRIFRRVTNGDPRWEQIGQTPRRVHTFAVDQSIEQNMYAVDDWHLLRSTVGGAAGTWEEVLGTPEHPLPPPTYHSLIVRGWNLMFLGAEVGVFVSVDQGTTWSPVDDTGMPNVPITRLQYLDDEQNLYAFTFGRGLWRTGI